MDISTQEAVETVLSLVIMTLVLMSVFAFPFGSKILSIIESWC
ncbi:MAG: hypothetical protein RR945_01455 [Erysipelotrichaceae bacterium]